MKHVLSATLIRKLPRVNADVRDTKQPGLVLRTRTSGVSSYLVSLGRGRWYTLGLASTLTADEARGLARDKLSEQSHGADPIAEKRQKHAATFEQFLTDHYTPWATEHLKSAAGVLARLRAQFVPLFGNLSLSQIDGFSVERWRTERLKRGVTKATANRDLAALRAALSKAVAWGLLADHPLRRIRQAKEDRAATVRYLTADEEARLRAALQARDDHRRAERESANAWRRQRGYPELPSLGTYTDHLTPIVLLALNTGLRRGELFGLTWRDVDLVTAMVTVRGEGAKSGRTRHVPLNTEAQAVLTTWRPQPVNPAAFVFPGDEGAKMTTLKTAWLKIAKAAKLSTFRFHDLRHTFASKLVQAGVDLASVRALLGHSDFALTLRYAHLAPENLAAAVAKLAVR